MPFRPRLVLQSRDGVGGKFVCLLSYTWSAAVAPGPGGLDDFFRGECRHQRADLAILRIFRLFRRISAAALSEGFGDTATSL
jgi:hypothetical protein